jgi:hypothetical protein
MRLNQAFTWMRQNRMMKSRDHPSLSNGKATRQETLMRS